MLGGESLPFSNPDTSLFSAQWKVKWKRDPDEIPHLEKDPSQVFSFLSVSLNVQWTPPFNPVSPA